MLEPEIIGSIKHKIYTNKKKEYPTAKPTSLEYREANKKLEAMKLKLDYSNFSIKELRHIMAYFIKYKMVENTKEVEDNLAEWSCILATAPWMANVKNQYYVKYLKFLIKNEVLKEEDRKLILCDGSNDYEKVKMEVKNKNSYDQVCEYIHKNKKKDDYITLKISTYHARSFMRMNHKNDLVKLIREFPRLKVEILCVGKHSGVVAQEGATRYYLEQAIKPGMLRLYDLAFWNKNQFKIRIVNKNIVDASLRCTILMDKNNIEFCQFGVWRVGNERGIHANIYDVESDSSMALQMNSLFDEAFSRGIPAKRNFEWVLYMIKKISYFAIVILIVVLIQQLPSIVINYKPEDIPKYISGGMLAGVTVILTIITEKISSWIKSKYIE